ncbi:PD-(D/E)XK nuclease family protein [Sulfurovum sp. zt1-1]|uniref:PD-(D/E)XK nuclease family protein n=1 Tax=Sulfurovum zhangzhouensis TaxID=3019067 RepID=A0ABT7QZP1_9BACT|nr:PD-(D/E)XK nuclease family protein [Sulfurovum zhangzhouensis]MDM5272306.1 PD-(D/E)XK nuclease family protein [Sulfurovum zhangzhouensis]
MLSRSELHVYPTSRALREVSTAFKQEEGFLPTLMRMDEFENRLILLDGKTQVDALQRILFLREAAKFEAFEGLNFDLELIRFFTRSDAIFKFYEELAAEGIGFNRLREADAYAEFDAHLDILEQLLENYHKILLARGLTDKAFIPAAYEINEGFIQNYQKIEIHLEGYLSRFELELLQKVSQNIQLIIHYNTSRFNKKMLERFAEYDIVFPENAEVSIDFSSKSILKSVTNTAKINVNTFKVGERSEQVALAFEKIEVLVQKGIDPEKMVMILPDESFKAYLSIYDKLNNLNFAMGYDYSDGRVYKSLEVLSRYLGSFEKDDRYLLQKYGVDLEKVTETIPSGVCNVIQFAQVLDELGLLDIRLGDEENKESPSNERVYEKYLQFIHTFHEEQLRFKEWLYIWMKALSKITIDDVRGGKVTVMGVLETRGVSFDGVVIVDFNEGIVPASSSKDQFLNSSVRAFSGLPTRSDRESLQKQYYKRLLEQSKEAVIIYCSSENRLPSKFLYELGLQQFSESEASLELLYNEPKQTVEQQDPVVESFDAKAITWSASRLKTFLECKRKYYYRYIQKIEAKKEEELNEGAFLHELLEYLFKEQNHYFTAEEMEEKLYRLMDQLLIDNDAKTNYQKLLWKEKLKGFINSQITHFESGWEVVEREKEFVGEIGGLRFKGRIDRIDQDATRTLVLDYKSGSTAEAQKSRNLETLKDFQMSIYHQILQSKYQNISLAFVKLFEDGMIEEITSLEAKNELLAEHIIELKQTTSFVAQKCEKLSTCTYCEFALMCERGEYL